MATFGTLGTRLLLQGGHDAGVTGTRFSPNGALLATSGVEGSCVLWDSTTGRFLERLEGHDGGVSAVAWSPDSSTLYSAGDDAQIGIWDADTGRRAGSLSGHGDMCLCVDASGDTVASGSFDATARLWDARAGKNTRVIKGHVDPVTSVHLNRDGTLLVTAAFDGLVRLWDLRSSHCLRTIVQDTNPPVSAARFSPNGKFVLTSSFGGLLQLWNYAQNKALKRYRGHRHRRLCLDATFCVHAGAAALLGGSEDAVVYLWDLQTKRVSHRLQGHTGPVVAVDSNPLRPLLVSGEVRGRAGEGKCDVRVWGQDAPPQPTVVQAPAKVPVAA